MQMPLFVQRSLPQKRQLILLLLTKLLLRLHLLLLQLLTMKLLLLLLLLKRHYRLQRLMLQNPLMLQTRSQLMRWRKFVSLVLHEGLTPPTLLL
jgi:hypothetical protein